MSSDDLSGLPLRDITVPVDKLFLWPDNPRLRAITDTEVEVDVKDIKNKRMQAKVLTEMSRPEFETDELVDSIRRRGFVAVDAIFVKRLDDDGNYLVLEGNRRTTALKRLLNRADELPGELLDAIKEVPAKELECDDLDTARDDIDFILGIRHHGGIKIWGPIQRAHNLYKRYLRESGQTSESFNYNVAVAKAVGATFTVPTRSVRNSMRVYRVFEQLRLNEYKVRDDHFSLIEAGITKRNLCNDYFEQSQDTFQLSDTGMERFNDLCLVENCSITNPRQFSAFSKIFEVGTEREVGLVEAGGIDIENLWRKIERRRSTRQFLEKLVDVREALESLPLTAYRGTKAETEEIERIRELALGRLVPLTSD